jgi:hypothetical protein
MTLKVITGRLANQCGKVENKVFHLPASDVDQYGICKSVLARYSTDAGQNIPNATMTIIDFEDVTYDPDSLVTVGAAWHFTAAEAGYYAVEAMINFKGTDNWNDTDVGALSICKNGSDLFYLDWKDSYSATTDVYMALGGGDLVYLAAGDTLDIRVWQSSGGALALRAVGANNHVAIWKI